MPEVRTCKLPTFSILATRNLVDRILFLNKNTINQVAVRLVQINLIVTSRQSVVNDRSHASHATAPTPFHTTAPGGPQGGPKGRHAPRS
jgi:hypothetical protein